MDLAHPALECGRGATPLVDARGGLSDRHRVGVVLQVASLWAHLRGVGEELDAECLRRATIDDRLQIRNLVPMSVSGGQVARPCQNELRDFLQWLFGVEERVAGRGQARRIARQMSGAWEQSLVDLGPRRCVRQLLRAAPFLWQRGYEVHRLALVATSPSDNSWRIIGPKSWRRNVAAAAGDVGAARELITSPKVRELWTTPRRLADADGRQLFELGHWRAATLRWQAQPPRSADERLLQARAHYALGRFEKTLELLKETPGVWSQMYVVACHHHLGDLHRALHGLARLEDVVESHGPREKLALADVALRVAGRRRDTDRQRDWIARCVAVAKGRWRGRAHLLAALGEYDRGRVERIEHHLRLARSAGVGEEFGWQLLQAEALLLRERGRLDGAAARLEIALRHQRRELRIFEAGRLWNDLAIVRYGLGQRRAAERAIGHAHRLLDRCDGPLSRDLTLSNLAEMRIRGGRLRGVDRLLERSREHSAMQGNARAAAHDEVLTTRWWIAQGRWDEALSCLSRAEEVAELGLPDLGEIRALQCWIHVLRGNTALARGCAHEIGRLAPDWLDPEEAPLISWLQRDWERFEALCEGEVGRCWLALHSLSESGEPGGPEEADEGEVAAGAVDSAEAVRASFWTLWESAEAEHAARLTLLAHRLVPGSLTNTLLEKAADHFRSTARPRLVDLLNVDVSGGRGLGARGRVLWSAIDRLLEDTPQTEQDLRRWFELLAVRELSVERHSQGRRLVLRKGAEKGEWHEAFAWRWCSSDDVPAEEVATLLRLVERLCPWLDQVRSPVGAAPDSEGLPEGWIGESPALSRAAKRLERLGRSELTVLILGETGTGKELAARWVHRCSGRQAAAFLPLNCAAVTETMLMSELFGHARGAFTGAEREHRGVFETAEGGTVFLDEIGDLPLAAQGMLLRVLQEGEVRRVGESRPRAVDARVVAATHRDLRAMVEEGTFREDLLFRLNVGEVVLPPLRERGEDVIALAEHFLAQADPEASLSVGARSALLLHSWPGNVRELKGLLDRAVVLRDSSRSELSPGDLGLATEAEPSDQSRPLHEWLEQLKRRRLLETLARCGGNQAQAARELGITRQAMSYLLRQMKK